MAQSRMNRRQMVLASTAAGAGLALASLTRGRVFAADAEPLFKISLAQWSLNKAIFGGQLDNLDFAKYTRDKFDIHAVEYVNQFFKDKAEDEAYLTELKKRATDVDVKSLLIMCDGEGALGDPNEGQRKQAVENHYKWVTAAKFLGCHSIRVNAQSSGSYEDQLERAADGLRQLSEFAKDHEINVIVENHGGLSSNGAWLAAVIKKVDLPNCGTLPDFGNFSDYDKYKGVEEMMPFAKAVSAKSLAFDENGDHTPFDFRRMMKIVIDAGYRGYVGIEYEGSALGEDEGILATKKLLEKIRQEMS